MLREWWIEVIVPLASALAIVVGALMIGALLYSLGKGDGASEERALCSESGRIVIGGRR